MARLWYVRRVSQAPSTSSSQVYTSNHKVLVMSYVRVPLGRFTGVMPNNFLRRLSMALQEISPSELDFAGKPESALPDCRAMASGRETKF